MLSMVAHHSAFGQSSTTPAGPATTTPLIQNTTSSTVDEGIIINSLVFKPDGTGWLTLESDPARIIPFNHTLTALNGYTIYSNFPYFTNNGSIVDLNSIDYSSQLIIDPSANVTLPARPMLSPSLTANILSLPPSSRIYTAPATQAPSQPPTTATIPPLTSGTATDPELQRFDQIADGCKATILRLYPGAETTNDVFLVSPQGATSADFSQMTQCNQLLSQGIAQYCNMLQTYDAAKCAHVNTPQILTLIDMTAIIARQEFLYGPGGLG